MRLVSYNILDGGEGRADPLAEIILAQRPDVVALIEADCDPVIQRIADRLGMPFIQATGRRHSVAILSRWPIVQTVNHGLLHDGLSNCLMEAHVRQQDGNDWIIGLAHLHPHALQKDDLIRQKEIEVIREIFRPHREARRPHLLAGDFNADSPVQLIDPAACKPSTQNAWKANGGALPRAAITNLLHAGYVDTFTGFIPSGRKTTGSFSTQFPGQRVDYIFSFGLDDRLKDAWIEHDRLAKYASDHFPIGIEVE